MEYEIVINDIRKCETGDCHCCFCLQRRYCEKGCKFCNGKNGMKDDCLQIKKIPQNKKSHHGRKKTS